MSSDSPAVILFDQDGYAMAVQGGVTIPLYTKGLLTTGIDANGDAQILRTDLSGYQILVGAGSAGTPTGGVISIQGVSGGTAIAISDGAGSITVDGTVTANQGTASALSGGWPVKITDGSVILGTGTNPVRIDPIGTTAQPVTDNGGSITIDTAQLPSSLVGGRLDVNLGAWLGSTAPTVGQKTMSDSLPIAIASDQSAIPVSQSGNWTVQQGTPPWSVSQSGTWTVQQGTPPWSVVGPGASGAAISGDPVRVGGSDGVNTRNILTDTAGRLRVVGAASDGAVVDGYPILVSGSDGIDVRTIRTATDGTVRIDPTGTTAQPVTDNGGSITVDTPQLPASLVGGRLDTNLGAWLGSTAPTVGQKTMASSIPIAIASDQSAISVSQSGTWTVQQGTPPWSIVGPGASGAAVSGNPVRVGGSDGVNTRDILTDTSGRLAVTGAAASGAAATGNPVLVAGSDGTNARTILTASDGTIRVDPTGTTAQPVTDNGGSLTVDTPQLPSSLVGGRLDVNAGAWLGSTAPTVGQKTMANSVPIVIASDQTVIPINDNGSSLTVDGTVTANQGTAVALSGAWPVKITDGTNTMPTGDIAARAVFEQISDGYTGPVAVKASGTPPSASDKALVVVLSPNQQAIPVSSAPATSTAGLRGGTIVLGGGSARSLNAVRATTYNEQTTNAQRSMASSSANDTSAGTGARTVEITYYDSSGNGPYTETITLNGTTAVNTVATNICYIESMTVMTAGTRGTNAGKITLYVSTGGGGGTIGTIGIGNIVAAVGDGRTLWAQHYVSTGKTCSITGMEVGASSASTFHIKTKSIGVANAADKVISGLTTTTSAYLRIYGSPITVSGPARIVIYGVPSTNGVTLNAAIDFFEN